MKIKNKNIVEAATCNDHTEHWTPVSLIEIGGQ